MGCCVSCSYQRVSWSSGSKESSNMKPAIDNEENQQQLSVTKRLPYGKRTDFGYKKDFWSRYAIGKLLGHGQFGYTFVATDKSNGDRVAVKRIDKSKVILIRT